MPKVETILYQLHTLTAHSRKCIRFLNNAEYIPPLIFIRNITSLVANQNEHQMLKMYFCPVNKNVELTKIFLRRLRCAHDLFLSSHFPFMLSNRARLRESPGHICARLRSSNSAFTRTCVHNPPLYSLFRTDEYIMLINLQL